MATSSFTASNQSDNGLTSKPLFAPPKSLSQNPLSAASSPSELVSFDENDPSVYFDRQSNTWRYELGEDDDGSAPDASLASHSELEWNTRQRAWIPVLDDDLVRAQQAAYSVAGVDEETPAAPILRRQKKRRKSASEHERDAGGSSSSSSRPGKQPRKRINTSVFVSGLPLDCTKTEIAQVFSRYGVLNEDDAGEPRVKMYADARTGMFKGEALVTYFKEESVDLAINVLDESSLRAVQGKMHPIMHVMKAEFGGEKVDGQEVDRAKHEAMAQSEGGTSHGNGGTSQQPQRKPLTDAERKRAQKRYARMNNKLLDWNSDSDGEQANGSDSMPTSGSTAPALASDVRQVCLRRMFAIAELEEDPTLLLDLKEDVREECESMGKVTNVILWDKEPEGIMTIKFAEHNAALACVKKMDGRYFGGRQIIAGLLPGKARFRRSDRSAATEGEEEDADEVGDATRQDAFGDWLESGGTAT